MNTEQKELPKGWRWARLSEICEIFWDSLRQVRLIEKLLKVFPSIKEKPISVTFIQVLRLGVFCLKKIAESGDILISVRAPVGPTNVANTRCCIGRGLAL